MSSKPHPAGVTKVIELLAQVDALDAEAEKLEPLVKRLGDVREQAEVRRQELSLLLRNMDVDAPGNFGWERRMGWFLAEMRRQTEALTMRERDILRTALQNIFQLSLAPYSPADAWERALSHARTALFKEDE